MAFQAGTASRNILLRKAYGWTGELNTKLFTVGNSQTIKQNDILSFTTGKVGQYISSSSITANTATTKALGYATVSGPLGIATSPITTNSSGIDTSSGFSQTQINVTIFDDNVELGLQGFTATVGTAQAVTAAVFTSYTVGSAYGLGRWGIGTAVTLSYGVNVSATTTGEYVVQSLNLEPTQTSSSNYPLMWGKIIAAGRQY